MATSQREPAEDIEHAVNALVSACGVEDAALAARFQAALSGEGGVPTRITRLSTALLCTQGTDDEALKHKELFATEAVRDGFFLPLAEHATSSPSLRCLATAMYSIVTGNDATAAHRRSVFATTEVRDKFFIPLVARARLADAVDSLARAMWSINTGSDAAAPHRRDVVASDGVGDLASAMSTTTVGSDAPPNRKNIFATETVRDGFFVPLAQRATSAVASKWLARALTYITRGSDAAAPRRRAIFATAAFRDNFFQPLVKHVASPDGVHALAKALCTITQGDDVAAPQCKNTFATDTVRDGFFLPLVKYATTTEASRSLGTAMLNIISGEDVTAPRRQSLFATEAILESFMPLANHTASHISLRSLARALSRTSDGHSRSASTPRSELRSVVCGPTTPNEVTSAARPTAETPSEMRERMHSADSALREDVSALQTALQTKLKVPLRTDDTPAAHRRDFLRLAGELDTTSASEHLPESEKVSAAVAAATAVLADPPDVVCCSPQVLREVNALRSRVEQVFAIFDAQLIATRNQRATEDKNSDVTTRLLTKAFEGQRRRLQGLLSTANSLFETAEIPRWVEENEKDRMRARQFLERVSQKDHAENTPTDASC